MVVYEVAGLVCLACAAALLLNAMFMWRSKKHLLYHPPSRGSPAIETDGATLRILTINVWSGSTYELKKSLAPGLVEKVSGIGAEFDFYETEERREERFQALIQHIVQAKPNVICMNEVMPCPSFARRVADRLGFDCLSHVGVAGIVLEPVIKFPSISEGDAILAHPDLQLCFVDRVRLSGHVFSPSFSFNLNDATQALCGSVMINGRADTAIIATHWHAGLLDDRETLEELAKLQKELAPTDILETKKRIDKSTQVRVSEALGVVRLSQRLRTQFRNVLLCGDLNTTAETPEFSVLVEGGFRDCFKPDSASKFVTWDPKNPNVALQSTLGVEGQSLRTAGENILYTSFSKRATKLDHILVQQSSKLQATDHKLIGITEVDGVLPSDHYGLFVEFF